MLDVDLVHDAGARRDDLELVERALAPAQELVALLVALVLEVDVALEGVGAAEHVDDHRVVDDQLGGRERVDLGRVAAELGDGLAHGGEVDDAGHAGEVLHDHAGRGELDLGVRLGRRVPAGERADVVGGDVGAVLGAQEVLQQHLQAEREALGALDRGEPEDLVLGSARLDRSLRSEAVGARHWTSPRDGRRVVVSGVSRTRSRRAWRTPVAANSTLVLLKPRAIRPCGGACRCRSRARGQRGATVRPPDEGVMRGGPVRRLGRATALLVVAGDAARRARRCRRRPPRRPPPPPPNPTDGQLGASRDAVTHARRRSAGSPPSSRRSTTARGDRTGALGPPGAGQPARSSTCRPPRRRPTRRARRPPPRGRPTTAAAGRRRRAARRGVDEFVPPATSRASTSARSACSPRPAARRTCSTGPAFADLIAEQQQQALDSLQRALVARVNADSLARKAEDDARAAAERARQASAAAAATVADVQAKAARAGRVARPGAGPARAGQRPARRGRSRATPACAPSATGSCPGRSRWPAAAAGAGPGGGRAGWAAGGIVRGAGAVRGVIDRAMSQLGVQYAWGGGNGRGPTLGVRDGGSPTRSATPPRRLRLLRADDLRVQRAPGCRCRGYSRNQYNAGRQVPIADLPARRHAVLRRTGGAIDHVALYVGNGMMIEAPYTGPACGCADAHRGPHAVGHPHDVTGADRASALLLDAMRDELASRTSRHALTRHARHGGMASVSSAGLRPQPGPPKASGSSASCSRSSG